MKKCLLIIMLLAMPLLGLAISSEAIPASVCGGSEATPTHFSIAKLPQYLQWSKVHETCPGGSKSCATGKTCCPRDTPEGRTYVCCPLPKAVCCSDQLHCCPNGTVCGRDEHNHPVCNSPE